MHSTHRFPIAEDSQVGEARRFAHAMHEHHGGGEHDGGRIAIIITELGRNLVRHAGGGELLMRENPADAGLEILAVDRGRGISNLAEAFRDGYSTHGTAGTGLGAIRRQADSFDIFTQPGKGTVIMARVGATPPDPVGFTIGAVSVAMVDGTPCGDAWDVTGDNIARILVADGLGHGPFAETAAREAVSVFRANPQAAPAAALEIMHLALMKTRGAAGSLVQIDPERKELISSGVGNVSMRLITEAGTRSLITDNGTLGANVRKTQNAKQRWEPGTILVMHSDGINSHWKFSDYPGLATRHPAVIAATLYRDHRRERDDSTIVVLKEKP